MCYFLHSEYKQYLQFNEVFCTQLNIKYYHKCLHKIQIQFFLFVFVKNKKQSVRSFIRTLSNSYAK
jgi:hypothetical protein